MSTSIEKLNSRYVNLKSDTASKRVWRIEIYDAEQGFVLYDTVARALMGETLSSNENLNQLLILLRTALSRSRALISPNPLQYWESLAVLCRQELVIQKRYISSDLFQAVERAVELFQLGVDTSALHAQKVRGFIESTEGKTLIFPETRALGMNYRDWVISENLNDKVGVVETTHSFSKWLSQEFDQIIFPSNPRRYLQRDEKLSHLRSLLFSGIAPNVTFVTPTWAQHKDDANFPKMLLRTIEVPIFPALSVNGGNSSIDHGKREFPYDYSIEDVADDNIEVEYESLTSDGDSLCRLVYLKDGLCYPVETDAKRISVLSRGVEGDWEVTTSDPFNSLEIGEILVACVGRSESQTLRESASHVMGDTYESFEESQRSWKQRLSEADTRLGSHQLHRILRAEGVRKAARLKYWLLPDSIQPGLANDFKVLLKFLGFSAAEIKTIMDLASQFDSALIQVGLQAGRCLSDAIGPEEDLRLSSGTPTLIRLEEFGGASYLLSPVIGVDAADSACRPHQIRQVVSLANGAKNI